MKKQNKAKQKQLPFRAEAANCFSGVYFGKKHQTSFVSISVGICCSLKLSLQMRDLTYQVKALSTIPEDV